MDLEALAARATAMAFDAGAGAGRLGTNRDAARTRWIRHAIKRGWAGTRDDATALIGWWNKGYDHGMAED